MAGARRPAYRVSHRTRRTDLGGSVSALHRPSVSSPHLGRLLWEKEPGFPLRAQSLGEKSRAGHTQEKNKGVWDSAKLLRRKAEGIPSTGL